MILDTGMNLQCVLAGAVAANQPEAHVKYITYNLTGEATKPAMQRSALSSTTDVNILTAPTVQGFSREVLSVSIYNKDTAAATVIVKTDDGTTERIIIKAALATLEVLMYDRDVGWYAMTAAGGHK